MILWFILQNLSILAGNHSQFSFSASLLICMYLLHNTYIHTYIPPLGGVCMYVCMYIVKNYILYNYCNSYNSVDLNLSWTLKSADLGNLSLNLIWNLKFELNLTGNLLKSAEFGCNFSPKIWRCCVGTQFQLNLGVNVHINSCKSYKYRINPWEQP